MVTSKKSHNLPIIEPEAFKDIKPIKAEELTKVCQSLRSMGKVRICEDPVMESWYCIDGQSLPLGHDALCSYVLFIRPFYENLFQTIRQNRRVVLTGSPGTSKSV